MSNKSINSPLLGYNTNVKHSDHLFHIQTEDSGQDHPHIITHLFTEGTILATKKTGYEKYLEKEDWKLIVRQMMKDQHKAMFVELRDGEHDKIATQILGKTIGHPLEVKIEVKTTESSPVKTTESSPVKNSSKKVSVIMPATMNDKLKDTTTIKTEESDNRGASIFETLNSAGSFGESLISNKSLDEVILTYLSIELDD